MAEIYDSDAYALAEGLPKPSIPIPTKSLIGKQLTNLDHVRFEIQNAIVGANNSDDTTTARLLAPVLAALDDHRGDVLIPALCRAGSMEQMAAMRADLAAGMTPEQIRAKHGSTIEQIDLGLVRQGEYDTSRAKAVDNAAHSEAAALLSSLRKTKSGGRNGGRPPGRS